MVDEYGLSGKVVIVTGAGGPVNLDQPDGISNGRAAAILLARAGAKVGLVGRSEAALENTAAIILKEGGEAIPLQADVSQDSDCQRLINRCIAEYGRIDGLDNNVGTVMLGDVTDLSLEDWRESFRTNVESMMLMCKYAIPHMLKNQTGGAIVNIGSLSAARPRGAEAYSVSKGAVEHLTISLSATHASKGIRANCIVLGPVFTPLSAKHITSDQDRERRRKASPLKREGSGWDTGYLVRFLLSDQARFLTGQRICLDGGASNVGPAR